MPDAGSVCVAVGGDEEGKGRDGQEYNSEEEEWYEDVEEEEDRDTSGGGEDRDTSGGGKGHPERA